VNNRWAILAVLFAVRATMAFQFQSVAAVAPLLGSELGVSLADIGVLIGLYFAPGVVLALPGGAIGQRFGDKTTVLGALLLMLAGSMVMAFAPSWSIQIAGRLVSGAGGVTLSVQMTKMLTDWFAGKEIATAMAILGRKRGSSQRCGNDRVRHRAARDRIPAAHRCRGHDNDRLAS
jgi:MFS family permease